MKYAEPIQAVNALNEWLVGEFIGVHTIILAQLHEKHIDSLQKSTAATKCFGRLGL